MTINRRELLGYGAVALGATTIGLPTIAKAAAGELTIAYNVNLPSWDPTTGPSAVNPTIQGLYQSVFDQYIGQNPDLSFTGGLLEKWGWNDAKTGIWMDVRKGAMWHDGAPVTTDDIIWSLTRAGDPKGGNPIQFIWGNLSNFKADGARVTAEAHAYDPALF